MSDNPLKTRLCEEFGVEFPIVAFSHCKDVVAAVINAGGMACYGALSETPEGIASTAAWIRERVGDKPFGMDSVMPASVPDTASKEDLLKQVPKTHWDFVQKIREEFNLPPAKFYPKGEEPPTPHGKPLSNYGKQSDGQTFTHENLRKEFEAMLDVKVPFIVSGLGSPAWVSEAAHARGISVWGLIGRVRQAVREAQAGVDYIVAQGYDAGGHTGEVGTFSLVPRVAEAVAPVPVIAAGGVASGRHLVASLALGAVGTWSGTLWLTTREDDGHMVWKQKLLDASEDDTVRSRCLSGKTIRQIKTTWTEMWDRPDAPGYLPMPLQGLLVNEIVTSINQNEIEELMPAVGGQGVGMMKEMKPCREVIMDIIGDASDTLDRIGGLKV